MSRIPRKRHIFEARGMDEEILAWTVSPESSDDGGSNVLKTVFGGLAGMLQERGLLGSVTGTINGLTCAVGVVSS